MLTRLKINSSQGIILAVITLLASIDFGCTSSRLTNVWKDPEFKNPPMTNMLIVAAKKSPVNRRIWEDVIAAELSAHGVTATPSYRLFEDSIPDPDQVGAAVRDTKIDGVLFIRRLPTAISTNYIPPSVKTEAVTRYNERKQTYSTYYRDVQQPGYTDTTKIVRHEVSIFTTQEGGHLVWAGTGEMIDPSSREAVRNEITGLVIPELARQGIIPAK
ncbi:MAG: hypothetical protein ABSB78_05135 [Bacteroidota bacterium]